MIQRRSDIKLHFTTFCPLLILLSTLENMFALSSKITFQRLNEDPDK